MGERKLKIVHGRGASLKVRAFSENQAAVSDPATGKTEKVQILRVVRNPANIDYDRRGVLTKGTLIETSVGPARVTSRPGQHGIVNAVVETREKES